MDLRVRHLSSYIIANSNRPLSLHEIAEHVNLSNSHLAHLFRREAGISVYRFLKTARLCRARQLLETTFLSIKEVMAQVGYNDPSHFGKEFKKMFGESPCIYRAHRGKVISPLHHKGQ